MTCQLESGVLKSLTINGLTLNLCLQFHYYTFLQDWVHHKFGAYLFRIVLSSWLTIPLIIIKSPSLAPLICFSLKFILSDIRIVTPTYFLGSFSWNTFTIFHFKVAPVFKTEFLVDRERWVLFLNSFIQVVSFYWRMKDVNI